MILIIIIVLVAIYFAFKLGADTGKTISDVANSNGMHIKYAKLLSHILAGHKDSQIFVETKTYIRAGVSNYGGSTIFHLQQCPNNTIMIDYEIKNNPIIPNFTLRFVFDDSMDQDLMMLKITEGIENKIKGMTF